MKKRVVKIIITVLIILIVVIGVCLYNENKYKLKNIKKLESVQSSLHLNTKEILMSYTEYLKKEKKVNLKDIGNIKINNYDGYRYSVSEDAYNYLIFFYDNNDDIIANLRVPLKFIPLEKYAKELNDYGTWIEILKLDPTTIIYDLDDRYFITEHLLINGDVLVIKYDSEDNSRGIEYTVYPRLAKEYLDVIKEILKEL